MISIHSLIRGRTIWANFDFMSASNFNPLPHTRENLIYTLTLTAFTNFNPLPHTRENNVPDECRGDIVNFNPLPHTRENSKKHIVFRCDGLFQSTPSYEGEHSPVCDKPPRIKISIHSLIRGRTPVIVSKKLVCAISIHSLIRGRTAFLLNFIRRMTLFQSTPSYEGEPLYLRFHNISIRFQSTPSYEGELQSNAKHGVTKLFQSTPSYEGELHYWALCRYSKNISIHSLIRGRTAARSPTRTSSANISIHSLIRGRTAALKGRPEEKRKFQSTPSYEGELRLFLFFYGKICISIHSLIRGRTRTAGREWTVIKIFQSTPSYEGEPDCGARMDGDKNISIHSLIRGRTEW